MSDNPINGVGLGLRHCHFKQLREQQPPIDFIEVLADNYLSMTGRAFTALLSLNQHYPHVLHAIGMSLGSIDPLNIKYLQQLKQLAQRLESAWVSDHLCWTSFNGHYSHELLPLPFTQEAIDHIVPRIQQVQELLGQRILIENVSRYINFKHNEMSEADFIRQIIKQADCYMLLDINNLYINACNHNFSSENFLQALEPESIKQIHLAGFDEQPHYLFDTHGTAIKPSVWQLYQRALTLFGKVPTIIERDQNIPELAELCQEAEQARQFMLNSSSSNSIEYATP